MTNKKGETELYALFDQPRDRVHAPHPSHRYTPSKSQRRLRGTIPGAHVKNMFLKDKKDRLWLVTCLEHRKIRIRDLEKQVGAAKASFGKPDLLWETLGIRPGAVSPFGLINDPDHVVTADPRPADAGGGPDQRPSPAQRGNHRPQPPPTSGASSRSPATSR